MVKRIVAKLLLLTMMTSALPMPIYGQTRNNKVITGTVDVTLNLDYPVKMGQSGESDLFLKITGTDLIGNKVRLEQELVDVGDEKGNVSEFVISNLELPQGTYQLELVGEGYTALSKAFEVQNYNVDVRVEAETFLAGDVNKDFIINELDVKILEEKVGTKTTELQYDLNRDGVVDITDLAYAYANRSKQKEKEPIVKSTTLIPKAVLEISKLEQDIASSGVGIVSGKVEDLFTEGNTVTFESAHPIGDDNPIVIPIAFNEPVTLSQMNIALGTEHMPTAFTVEVEEEDGTIRVIPYAMAMQKALLRSTSNTYNMGEIITIDLGNKVPIKKVTIKVTSTQDENSKLTSIGKVEFLEDVLENALPPDKGIIKNIGVASGDQSVTLQWDQVANVTGYLVEYGDQSGNYTETIRVKNNEVTIDRLNGKELINYKEYYFRITAINGDWKGEASEEVVGIPKPKSVPLPPDNPNLKAGNEKLYFSWKASESASGYNVYYKKVADREFIKVPDIKDTQYVVNGLENGVEYELYVTAYNELGESRPSITVVGTPEKEEIIIPDIPTYNLINTPNNNTTGIKTDHITNIELVDKNNVAPEYPSDFQISDVVDGDFHTHWAARKWWESKGITVTFDQPYEMNYVAYISRLDGKYKDSLSKYSITVWESDDAEPKKLVSGARIPSYSNDGLAILPFEKSTVKKITVEVAQWDGSPTNISASELMFYEYYGVDDDIRALFADNTYTTLAPTATQAEIDRIRELVNGLDGRYYVDSKILLEELAMAEELLKGSTAKLGEIVEVYSGRTTSGDGERGFAMGLNTNQPLGVVAKADEEIVVYVDAPKGANQLPSLVFTQYFAETGAYQQSVALTPGRNVIKVPNINDLKMPKGGSVYVTATDVPGIKLHIKGIPNSKNELSVIDIPNLEALDLRTGDPAAVKAKLKEYILELTNYVNNLRLNDSQKQTDYRNSTEIETEKVMLSLPATEVLKGLNSVGADIDAQVDRLFDTLHAWEETMELQYTVLGLSKDAVDESNRFPTSRMNVRYMRMFGKAFMYATSGHIGIGYGSVPGTMGGASNLVGSPNYFGWGINHEIGHVLNYRDYVYAEVTNNIFSLFAQEATGETIRLKEKYPQIYQKVSVPTPGRPGDVFVNLGMYWQLHLAYDNDKVTDLGDFYPRLHQAYRASSVPGGDQGFVRIASDVAQKDLTEFFTHWGVEVSEETKNYIASKGYPREERKLYYLSDDAFEYRLAGGTGLVSTVADMTAEIKQDATGTNNSQRVEVIINVPESDKEHILGYEILRNNEVVGFTTEPTYTDIIGAANNRAFEYTVNIYDKLLNKVATISASELKISHDGSLAKDGWTVSEESGALIIDTQKVNSLSGIKFNNLPSGTHQYTVKVSQELPVTTTSSITINTTTGPAIGVSEWMTAKEGSIDGAEGLVYFNKPGAPAEDTRIWTYDARYIMIEGIAGLTLDNVDLIVYPGDNVEIKPGAIGRIGHDFVYGPGSEDKIAAGSLVIVGDYRGDAIYNVIKPKGMFEVGGHGDYQVEEHIINGYSLMFAELPEDGAVSTISDGVWIYVIDEMPFAEADEETVLERIKVELYRVDNAETLEGERLVSDTMWIEVPNEEEMPIINFTGTN